MKVKMHGHCWLGRAEILRFLQVQWRLVLGRVRLGPKIGGSPISALCSYGRVRSGPKVGGVSHLCAVFLWQVVYFGLLPLQSVLCIADLTFVYPLLCLLISHISSP
jgi:hypothetical protein